MKALNTQFRNFFLKLFKRNENTKALSPWRTDHARLLHSLSLFMYKGQPQGLSLLRIGERVTTLLSGPAALSVPSRGTSWHPACRVKADSGHCHHHQLQPGLAACALWDLPFSEQPWSTGRRRKMEELSLASGLICLHLRPKLNALL